MKKIFMLLVLLMPLACYSQGSAPDMMPSKTSKPSLSFSQEKDVLTKLTSYEKFSSKTGTILKFIDVNQSLLLYGSSSKPIDTGIRIILSNKEKEYFFHLDYELSSRYKGTAMIEYLDLVEINKSLEKLKTEKDTDIQLNPNYLENKFITKDGFVIGYYISRGEAQWYMELDRNAPSTYVPIDYIEDVMSSFRTAQSKIEELKMQQ